VDKELRDKWVAALREEGKYQQGRRLLKEGDRWCCLGVLCDISGLGKWIEIAGLAVFEASNVLPEEQCQNYTISSTTLPGKVKETLGMGDVIVNNLIRMNDDENKSFSEIASYVEQNL
jgi:hypothetical protein